MIASARFQPLAALPLRTPSEWPHGEEDEVGIHSHMASPSGRILTAPGTDTVPGCPGNKGSVWYAPPTGTHAENVEMETGCTVMDRYLCTVQAVLQGLLVTGERTKEEHIAS